MNPMPVKEALELIELRITEDAITFSTAVHELAQLLWVSKTTALRLFGNRLKSKYKEMP